MNIVEARKILGLSQEEVAHNVKIERHIYRLYEHGYKELTKEDSKKIQAYFLIKSRQKIEEIKNLFN